MGSPDVFDSYIRESRIARLATVDPSGQPLVVPVCYAYDGQYFFSAIDEKPKRVPARNLKRLRNIDQHPKVSMVIDTYSDDWSQLEYVIVQGEAEVLFEGAERQRAIILLRNKYPQYREMTLRQQPVIKIRPNQFIHWKMKHSGST